jgi:hypothetical protein
VKLGALVLLSLVACGGHRSTKDGITVELASVTLANDCGSYGMPPPPPEVMAAAPMKREAAGQRVADEDISAGAASVVASETYCPPGADCRSAGRHRGGCQQTSMQLYFKALAPAVVKIKKVELLDVAGKYVQDLASRSPTHWNDSAYVAWDEKLVPGKQVSTSYALAAPNWNKLGGREKAQTKKYHLRVVVDIGDAEHTLEKLSISPAVMQAMPEPDVVTMR